MALLDAFVGGMYKAVSPTLAADVAVNVYPETRRVDGSAKERWLLGTPGLKLFATASDVSCRGWFSEDDLTLVTVGGTLYSVDVAAATLTSLGTIANNGEPVSYASNGQGVAIVLPFSGPVTIAFMQAYFLINQRNSPVFWFSALEDGTTWDALDFVTRSNTSDNLVALAATQDRVWTWGTESTTLFYNSGDADTPFLPYPGTTTHIGLVNPWVWARRADVFTWLAPSGDEQLRIVKASGVPTPTSVSTPPIEAWLKACPSLDSCEVISYADPGHGFTAFTAPMSPDDVQTYVWDDYEQLWHARAGWDVTAGAFLRWRPRGVCQVGGLVLVGDYSTGALYTLDAATYTDIGVPLVRDRVMPYPASDNQWLFLDQVELGAQVGIGLVSGQGSAPVADLYISRNAGQTWLSAGAGALGEIGNYLARVIWRRLGRVRMDRFLIRVRQSDPVPVAWFGLWLRSSGGTGTL
jgi:hypothetical protein